MRSAPVVRPTLFTTSANLKNDLPADQDERALAAAKPELEVSGPQAVGAALIDVVPVEDGTAANHKCDICGRRPSSSCFEVGQDVRTVLLCAACVGVLRAKGMSGLRSLARQSRSAVAGALPAGSVGVRILVLEREDDGSANRRSRAARPASRTTT